MKKESLIDSIKNGSFNVEFEVDGVGMTWGVSYVRLVIGDREKFDSIEHFFYSTLKSDRNMTSMIQGGETWEQRVDLEKWAMDLKVEETSQQNLIAFIEASIKDITDNLKYWEEENTIDLSKLTGYDSFDSCWIVKETTYTRHYINSTEIYLAETKDKYFCIEGHWES